jgi:hypothetical protein
MQQRVDISFMKERFLLVSMRRLPAERVKLCRGGALASRFAASRAHTRLPNQRADNPNMKSDPAGIGVERYVDSPMFIDIVLGLFALALGYGAWLNFDEPDRNLLAVAGLAIAAVLCVLSIFAQKRRTFAFDRSTQALAWTSRGLRERTSGSVDFKDVDITLEPSPQERYATYRIMVNTPQGSWPLTTGYDSNITRVEAQGAKLRTLLGKSPDTLIDDSIKRLKQQNDLISAAKMVSRQHGISVVQAYGELVDEQRQTTP